MIRTTLEPTMMMLSFGVYGNFTPKILVEGMNYLTNRAVFK